MLTFRQFCNEGFTDKIVRGVHLYTHQKIRKAGQDIEAGLPSENDLGRKIDLLGKLLSIQIRNTAGLTLAGLNRGDGPLSTIGKIKSLIN